MQIPKVLLVNDDAASRFALESLLIDGTGAPEYELVSVSSGHEALREVLQHDFAVILLDANMPGMDGFETAEAIHSHPRSAGVPIIFITAHYTDELHRLKAYQKGAVDYLITPVIPQILQTKVAVFVELTKKALELQASTDALARLNQDLRVQRVKDLERGVADLERVNSALEQEVAERKVAEERAHAMTVRDPLTGLVNRRALIAQLEHAVASCDRHQGEFALLFIDLNQFKSINDTLGHDVGDELLRQVAARILAAVRVSDVVARLGADEFVVLLDGRGAASNAAQVARKIGQAHALPFEAGGQQVRVDTAIGIGLYPQDAASASQLMKNADTAMYHAKQRGGGIEFFHDELNAREVARSVLAEALEVALEQEQFEVRFLPRAHIATGALCGVEATLVWHHPQQGMLAGVRFLDEVNDRALLEAISDWLIQQACTQLAAWRDAGVALLPLTLSVDLVLHQIDTMAAARVLELVQSHKLAPGQLTLEIPEYLLAGPGDVGPALRMLHGGGLRLAVDDFGSAGAALATLKELPLDLLKVDAAFIEAIGVDGGSDMAAAIVHLGRALGINVLAQRVEREDQRVLLAGCGCNEYQGPLFSDCLTAAAMLALLTARAAAPPLS